MKTLILAGSNRKNSTSTKLARYVARLLVENGGEVHFFSLNDKPIPFYSPDEDSQDKHLLEMKAAAMWTDAFILCTPEYHGGVSGVLKNALDHMGSSSFDSKIVLAISSAGGAVGVSPLQQIQTMVRYVHGVNCPEWISIGGDNRKFDSEGEPEDPKLKQRVLRAVQTFTKLGELLTQSRME